MTGVLDYGAGNLCSVTNTLDALQADYAVIRTAEGVSESSRLILPGVGHFGQMMRALDAMELRRVLMERIHAGVPFLGVCLGMQALFEASEEAPEASGLGMLSGRVRRFSEAVRVPHMGWNQVRVNPDSRMFRSFAADPWFYFAHSYYVPASEATSGKCDYSLTYTAAVEHENIFGVQFHPEKSGAAGQLLLSNFLQV